MNYICIGKYLMLITLVASITFTLRHVHINSEKHLLALPYLPAQMYRHGSYWMDFCEIWCWELLWKSVKKLRIWLNLDHSIGKFTGRPECIFLTALLNIFYLYGVMGSHPCMCIEMHFFIADSCMQLNNNTKGTHCIEHTLCSDYYILLCWYIPV